MIIVIKAIIFAFFLSPSREPFSAINQTIDTDLLSLLFPISPAPSAPPPLYLSIPPIRFIRNMKFGRGNW